MLTANPKQRWVGEYSIGLSILNYTINHQKTPPIWKVPFNGSDAYASEEDTTVLQLEAACTLVMSIFLGIGS